MEQANDNVQVRTVTRLTKQVYEALEEACGKPYPDSQGNTAYALGIQRVLYELRKGIVIDD